MNRVLKTKFIHHVFQFFWAMVAIGVFSPAAPAQASRRPAMATASAPTRADVLAQLRALQGRLTKEIGLLETSIKKRLQESTTVSLKEEPGVSSRRITRLGDQLDDIDKKRTELLARREFVDQMILQVDSKWNGQKLQAFLEQTALDLALADLTNPQGSGDTWRFLTYLSITMREVPSGRDDVLGILEDYMAFSSILNPKTPTEFLNGRDYTNISSSVSARPVPRAEAADGIESKLKAEAKPTHAGAPPADIQIKMNIQPPANNGVK